MSPPAEPALKDPRDFKLIGKHVQRLDSLAKTNGTAVYTIDMTRPGMLTAVVAHPPKFGAKVASFDASKARAVPGVVEVVQIPTGVAVLADGYWTALKGREALTVAWDESGAETRGTAELLSSTRLSLARRARWPATTATPLARWRPQRSVWRRISSSRISHTQAWSR